jgi:nickel/cobalt exporter
MKRLFLLHVLFLALAGPALSLEPQAATVGAAVSAPQSESPLEWRRLYRTALQQLVRQQKILRRKMTQLMVKMREQPLGAPLWTFLGLAFFYGMIHALGPGHGKIIVGSYFLSRRGSLKQGVLLGLFFAATHVFTAVVLLLTGHALLQATASSLLDRADLWLGRISALLLILIGSLLVVRTLRSRTKEYVEQRDSLHQPAGLKDLSSIAASAGLVPCPGAALILLFALSQQLLVPGLLAMLALALGMALTVSLSALATMAARGALLQILPSSRWAVRAGHLFGAAGGLIIAGLGIILLASGR